MPQDAKRDEQIMALFDAAMELPLVKREQYLRDASAGDEPLFERVRQLLAWEDKLGDFLLQPVIPRVDLETLFRPGQILNDRFKILRRVAEGGMAIVYEAIDEKHGDRVALKCPKFPFQRRLSPEVRSALAVSHHNICRVQAIHTVSTEQGDIDILTMEFLDGETLLDYVQRQGPLPVPQALAITRQICEGLSEAHRKRVVHGDLKSNNVILARSADEPLRVVITDFGLARYVPDGNDSRPLPKSSQMRGTPEFLAPEIWRGEAHSTSSDMYALGVILYELVTAKRPFPGGPPEDGVPRTWVPPSSIVKEVPKHWDQVIFDCLALNPADRPHSAREVADRLSDLPSSRNRWLVGIALASVAASLGLANTWMAPGRAAEPVRLAVLPFAADRSLKTIGDGVAHDVSDRLIGLRGANANFSSIPLTESLKYQVDRPDSAGKTLGATHVLQVQLRQAAPKVLARVQVINVQTGQSVWSFEGGYGSNELVAFPKAVVGAVTAGLHLKSTHSRETVNAAGYSDYAQGVAHLRRDSESADLAIPVLESAARHDPTSALPYAGLAEAWMLKFRHSEQLQWRQRAEDALRQAQLRNPDAVEVHLVAGALKQSEGAYEQAASEFQRVLQVEPANADALRRLASAYGDMNLSGQAIQAYGKAVALQPGYYRPYMELGVFHYFRARYEDALTQFRMVTKLAPAMAQGHFNLAAAYMDLGRYGESEVEYQEALRLHETRDYLIGMGALRAYQKRYAESTVYYERARAKGPDSALLLSNLADAYRRTGRNSDARKTFQIALKAADENLVQDPRSAYIRSTVAYLCARTGDAVRARREVQQALRLGPDETKARRWAVLTYTVLGENDRVLALLASAPPHLLSELARQPDLADLQQDSRFIQLLEQSRR